MTFTNVHNPPDNCRTVLCLMEDDRVMLGFRIDDRWWCQPERGVWQTWTPVGWCEIDEQETDDAA